MLEYFAGSYPKDDNAKWKETVSQDPKQVTARRDFAKESPVRYINKNGVVCWGNPWEDRDR